MVSLAALYVLQHFVIFRMAAEVPVFRTMLFPADFFLSLPLIGMFLGISGAVIALGRLKF